MSIDLYNLVIAAKLTKGGGGDEPVLIDKTISTNGTYNASSDSADGYKKVVANVPNSYSAADEGKVVSNGALAAQTSVTKTANGTYDTTTNDEVVVNVPQPSGSISITQNGTVDVTQYASANVNVSGGGGIGTLLHTESLGQISCSSATAISLDKTLLVEANNEYDILIVEVSNDTPEAEKHLATASVVFVTGQTNITGKEDTSIATVKWNCRITSPDVVSSRAGTSAGIYPASATANYQSGRVSMPLSVKYNAQYTSAIDSTYTARVYGVSLYDLIP